MNKRTTITGVIVLLALSIFPYMTLPSVNAANVEIIHISPDSQMGKVGEIVHIIGTINTTNGQYEILFEKIPEPIAMGNAIENNVNASFLVPMLPGGNYTIKLRDVTTNANATSWFCIKTEYLIEIGKLPHPKQFQEGAAVNISIRITGGKEKTVYAANVTVKTPANEKYWTLVNLSNTTDTGIGNATITYPEDFNGNAHTNYTGIYTAYFNETLTSGTFFIGLTDLEEYHRRDLVSIKAVDYSEFNNSNVTITIKFGNKTIDILNKTVVDGVVEANWTAPDNLLVGNYSLSMTPTPKSKKVNDTQVFAVPGFKTEIVPRNLANEPVPNVLVKVYDKWANTTYNVTSNENGITSIWLERGDYNSTAYFKKVRVNGVLEFSLINEGKKLDMQCQLTNLNISVVSQQNTIIKIPFVLLNITYTYTSELDGGGSVNETIISQTDITGTACVRSLLLNAVYRVEALRYGKVFNKNNDTFSELKSLAWNNVTIICPVKPLKVDIVDVDNAPITDALVEIQEVMGGLKDEGTTDQSGHVTFNCVFGIYNVKVYSNKVFLNATIVELFDEKIIVIRCTLYNLPIYVKVVDYFGQPIPNINVTLERNRVQINSKRTGTDGIADFREVGGEITIKTYLANQNLPAKSFTLNIYGKRDKANPIVVKIESVVLLAGFLINTAHFTMAILILATITLIVIIEVTRRRRLKLAKTTS